MRSCSVQIYKAADGHSCRFPADPHDLEIYKINIRGTRFVAHMSKCDWDRATMTGALQLLSGWVDETRGVLAGVAVWPLTFSGWQIKGRCARERSEASERISTAAQDSAPGRMVDNARKGNAFCRISAPVSCVPGDSLDVFPLLCFLKTPLN